MGDGVETDKAFLLGGGKKTQVGADKNIGEGRESGGEMQGLTSPEWMSLEQGDSQSAGMRTHFSDFQRPQFARCQCSDHILKCSLG